MQHARCIANATGVHRHIDDLLLDLRRLTGVAIHQQEGPSTPLEAPTAPIALLAFRRQTMLDDIGPLAIGAVQHLHNHRCSLSHGWFCSAQTLIQDSRSTALKHLRVRFGALSTSLHTPLHSAKSWQLAPPATRVARWPRQSLAGAPGHPPQ